MSKPLKIILGIVGGVIALLVVALVAAVMMFDANSFRGKLSAEIKDRYHRDLTVGDIKLSIFPWLRVKIANVNVSNGEGFSKEPFAQVGQLELGVRLLPLLQERKIEATTIDLTDLTLNLEKDSKGASNWDDFTKPKDKADEDKDKDQDGSNSIELKNIDISGVDLKNVTLHYSDAQSGKRYAVDHLNFKTGALKIGQPFDVESSLALSSKSPEALIDLKLNSTVLANFDAKTYSLTGLKLNADLSGSAVPGGKQTVQLSGEAFFDQGKGTLLFNKAELQAAGITLNTDITGTGLTGDTPRLSGPIKIKPFSPRDVMSKLGMKPMVTADKDALGNASLNAQYMGTFKSASLSGLTLALDQTTIMGNLSISDFASKAISFALKADKLDADRYMAPKTEKTAEQSSPVDAATKKAALNATKIPSDALNALNANGTLDVGTLKASGLNMSNVHLKLSGTPGSAKQQELSANLYGGSIKATTRVNGKSYAVNTQLQGLNTAPFLKDLTGKDPVSGVGNLSLDITTSGATVGDARRALNGNVNFALQNGAVKGFNLGQIIRSAQATFAGNTAGAQDKTTQQTDFATFSASGKFVNGVLKSDTLDAKSPLLRLSGAGEIDLVNETINYIAKPTIVETSQGQGGKELDALRGVAIPIELTGNMYAPKYRVMFGDIAKQQATQQLTKQFDSHQEEIQKKLNEKLGSDLGGQLGGALGKLFGSQKTAPAAPATPQPEQQPATAPETKPGT